MLDGCPQIVTRSAFHPLVLPGDGRLSWWQRAWGTGDEHERKRLPAGVGRWTLIPMTALERISIEVLWSCRLATPTHMGGASHSQLQREWQINGLTTTKYSYKTHYPLTGNYLPIFYNTRIILFYKKVFNH